MTSELYNRYKMALHATVQVKVYMLSFHKCK